MGSIWLSKKSLLYFGGAAIILLGGLIVVLSPYHYINFAVGQNDQRTFEIYNQANYYPQLEISVSLKPGNQTLILIDLSIQNNLTSLITPVNFTLDEETQKVGPDNTIIYEDSIIIDLVAGNYTITIDRVEGTSLIDIGFNQISDSRLFIVIGGSMNIFGIIMIIAGYCVPGSLLPSDSDTIISWGYDDEKTQDSVQ
jgi:hypothetical protein